MLQAILRLRELREDTRAIAALEYALIAAVIAVVMVVGASLLGTDLSGSLTSVAGDV